MAEIKREPAMNSAGIAIISGWSLVNGRSTSATGTRVRMACDKNVQTWKLVGHVFDPRIFRSLRRKQQVLISEVRQHVKFVCVERSMKHMECVFLPVTAEGRM